MQTGVVDLYEIHQHQLAEDRGDPQQGQTVANIEDGVLQRKLLGQTVHRDDKLDTVGLQVISISNIVHLIFAIIFTFKRVLLFIS